MFNLLTSEARPTKGKRSSHIATTCANSDIKYAGCFARLAVDSYRIPHFRFKLPGSV